MFAKFLVASSVAFLLISCGDPVYADSRFCGEPVRDISGKIVRSSSLIAEFERLYPLPPQFKRADFQINHAVPLVCGGCDKIENLIWMAKPAKTCAEWYCQDRHEQLTMCPKSFHR